jgi:hypothetical protein
MACDSASTILIGRSRVILCAVCAHPVPRITHGEAWELGLTAMVRSSTASGWAVRVDRGRVRLLVRQYEQPMATVGLPFDWGRQQVASITARVRNIYLLTLEGHGLDDAAAIAEGQGPQRQDSWAQALRHFCQQKLDHGGAIKPSSWLKHYAPVLEMAVPLLEGPAPAGGRGRSLGCLPAGLATGEPGPADQGPVPGPVPAALRGAREVP